MKLHSVKEGERGARESVCSLRVMAKEIELLRERLFICKINHQDCTQCGIIFFKL